MLNPFELREIAIAKKKQKQLEIKPTETKPLDSFVIQKYMSEMEELIKGFAAEGELDMFYKFTQEDVTPSMIKQVALEFKERHPQLFIIENLGERLLHIDWSCKHEV